MRKIVCLCGSTRFSKEFQEANLRETLDGNIVLTIGCDMKSDQALFAGKSEQELATIKENLDALGNRPKAKSNGPRNNVKTFAGSNPNG
jgi:hypothetical protein